MTLFSELRPDASVGDILFANPDRYMPLLQLANNVMRGEGDISVATRELLAAYVSALNSCAFCHGVHAATAERFGVDTGTLAGLLDGIETADIDADLKPLFSFARQLTLDPSKVTDANRKAVLGAGHTKEVLQDVIAITALFAFFNRLVDGHGLTGGSNVHNRDAEILFTLGYAPPG